MRRHARCSLDAARPAGPLEDTYPMKIAVPRESAPGERRVAIVADSVKRLAARRIEVAVEAGAGVGAGVRDEEYAAAGAAVVASRAELLAGVDVVVRVRAPAEDEVAEMPAGSALVCVLEPRAREELVRAIAARGITAIAADLIPRTTAAQGMDVLSS
jgi:NAD(P) transhydrogenase subunit alpha